MKNISSARAALWAGALVLSSSLGLAQTGNPAGKPAAAPQGQDKPAKAPEAAARPPQAPGVQLSLPVSGLAKENAAKVESALTALSREFYACDACHSEHAQKGKCPGCGVEMTAHKAPLLKEAKAAPDKGTVALTTNPGCELKLSQVERALKSASAQIDAAKMTLAGKSVLLFPNAASQEEAMALGKMLADAGLFQTTRANFDAASKSIHVEVSAGATAPTRAAVDAALEKAGSKLRLADVVWGTPAAPAART